MAVFRIEKTRDYTVMSNHHLRNKELSLKAKGLLSLMLSLPEGWDYTTKGLAYICKDGVDSICATVRELEQHGYIRRQRIRNANGRLGDIEYTILEHPDPPKRENPVLENPVLEKPEQVKPEQENPAQLNIDKRNKEKSNTDLSSTDSIPFLSEEQDAPPVTVQAPEKKRKEKIYRDMDLYRELIKENIDYEVLLHDLPYDHDRIDEIVELLVETVCADRQYIRVAGNDYPAEVVRSKLLKLECEHIRFVFDCMKQNTTKIRNIRQYLLAALWNAPTTIGNYYSALVNHDMYGDSD